jgi:thiamine-phosphate pyrophosphorylase
MSPERPPISAARGLYAILDLDAWRSRGVEPLADVLLEEIAEALLAARPAVLQLRAKHEGARATLGALRRLRVPTARAGIPLFANDRPDLALLAGADGVHVGQDDLSLEDVRRIAPSLLVGISTHDLDQLDRALAARPDYVAFGPVFGTRSKERPDPVVGLDSLAAAAARSAEHSIPLVAIGGIDGERVADVARRGVALAAAIGELVVVRDGRPDLAATVGRAQALSRALGVP